MENDQLLLLPAVSGEFAGQVFLTGLDQAARRPRLWGSCSLPSGPKQSPAGGQGDFDRQCGGERDQLVTSPRELRVIEQRSRKPSLDGGLGGAPPTKKEKTEVLLNWSFYGYFISSLFIPLKQPY